MSPHTGSPYFGQAFWFKYLHGEQIPGAIERYTKEVLRVFGVLESVLSKQEWLVGGKLSIVDMSFVTYVRGPHILPRELTIGDMMVLLDGITAHYEPYSMTQRVLTWRSSSHLSSSTYGSSP